MSGHGRGRHRPNEHSREIDIRTVQAWMKAGRPRGGPREWRYALRADRRAAPLTQVPAMREPWAFWNVVVIVLAVLFGAAMVAVIKIMITDDPTIGVARWI